MNKNKKADKQNKQDWQIFCNSYLNLARLACLEIVYKKHKPSNAGPYYRGSEIEDLYIPMRYNLNYAIEIFLKNLSKVLNNEKVDKYHNIENLLGEFKKNYKIKEVNDLIKKKYEEISEMKTLLKKADKPAEVKRFLELNKKYNREIVERVDLAKLELEDLDKYFNKIIKICYKYFSWKDLDKHILSSFEIKDIQNDGFRYPEDNKLTINIDYKGILEKVKKEEKKNMKNILKDINGLERYFNSLAFLINTAKVN